MVSARVRLGVAAASVGALALVALSGAVGCRRDGGAAGANTTASASTETSASANPPEAGTPRGETDAATIDAASSVPDRAGAAATSGAAQGRLCFPPVKGPFDPCPKGAMAGEAALQACIARAAKEKPKMPRFRVGRSTWMSFSPTTWRCVPAPLDTKTHVTVGDLAGLDEAIPATCASQTLDMEGPNAYGAIFFRCSTRRSFARDEVLEPTPPDPRAGDASAP